MYCKKCGTELRENDKFCYHCGRKTGMFQRFFSSRALAGSIIAVLVMIVVVIFTYCIWTGKWNSTSEKNTQNEIKKEIQKEEVQKEDTVIAATPVATPYISYPADVTKEKKKEMEPLTDRLMPFLAYSASYYAEGAHTFLWNDKMATVMALFNLEHYDKTVRYGDSMDEIQKKTKKEMKKIFGSNLKYNYVYEGRYPGYVYRPTGNTLVFNVARIPGKEYNLKIKKITEYKENKFRLDVEAYLTEGKGGTKGKSQKYTVTAKADEESAYGYVVSKIKLSK